MIARKACFGLVWLMIQKVFRNRIVYAAVLVGLVALSISVVWQRLKVDVVQAQPPDGWSVADAHNTDWFHNPSQWVRVKNRSAKTTVFAWESDDGEQVLVVIDTFRHGTTDALRNYQAEKDACRFECYVGPGLGSAAHIMPIELAINRPHIVYCYGGRTQDSCRRPSLRVLEGEWCTMHISHAGGKEDAFMSPRDAARFLEDIFHKAEEVEDKVCEP